MKIEDNRNTLNMKLVGHMHPGEVGEVSLNNKYVICMRTIDTAGCGVVLVELETGIAHCTAATLDMYVIPINSARLVIDS